MSGNVIELWNAMGLLARAVVVVLLAMSVYSLSVAVDRAVTLRRARRQSLNFAAVATRLWDESRLDDLLAEARSLGRSHLARVVSAGLAEYDRKARIDGLSSDEVLESTRRAAERAAATVAAELRRGTGSLATIGATAPFVGLFGTVVGIINAFSEMAKKGTGGIQVVAGGIAEALVTTALGLLVALPAVWLFNLLTQRIDQLQVEMGSSATELVDRLLELAPIRAARHGRS